jgi:hypothetical protein
MSIELVERRHYRHAVPRDHRESLDTRLRWLWNQRFGTVQTVWKDSPDVLDVTAATIILQAIMAADLDSIMLLFRRLEGGAQIDEDLREQASMRV